MRRQLGIVPIVVVSLLSFSASGQQSTGPLAEISGGWRLHRDGAKFLDSAPKDLVWDIQAEGNSVKWNIVIIPEKGKPRFESFENEFGASPKPIVGSTSQAKASVAYKEGQLVVDVFPATGDLTEIFGLCSVVDHSKFACQGFGKKVDGSTPEYAVSFDRM